MDVILVADETKNIEIKAKIILKKMPRAEYESIMMPYKRLMLQFERDLRKLADNGVISFSIVDKFTKEFNFAELQRLHFDSEERESFQQSRMQQQQPQQFTQQQPPSQGFSFGQQQPATSRSFGLNQQPQQQPTQQFAQQQQNQSAQRPSSFSFGQSQPTPPPTSSFGFRNTEAPAFSGQSSSPRPGTAPPPSSFGKQESQSGPFGQSGGSSGGGISSFSDISKETPSSAPSFSPRSPPPSQPSFGLSDDLGGQAKPQDSKISVGIDEEDRATGIAILRKKMLMELRKIRNVVEQEDDSSF